MSTIYEVKDRKKSLEEVSAGFSNDHIHDAVKTIISSVKNDADSLTFQDLCAQFGSDVEQCVEEDTGDGVSFSEGMISLLDRSVELASLSELKLKTVEVASNIEDVVIALNSLPRLWRRVMSVLFAELRDPVNSAGLEQTLTLEKLKAGEIETREGESSWSDEKKARVKVARERNTTLTQVAHMVFLALSAATRDVLSIAAHHSSHDFSSAEHCAELKAILAVCTVLAIDSTVEVNATQIEEATHTESTKWMLYPVLTASMALARDRGDYGSCAPFRDAVSDSMCFHKRDLLGVDMRLGSMNVEGGNESEMKREGGEQGMRYEASARSFLSRTFLSLCGADAGAKDEWMQVLHVHGLVSWTGGAGGKKEIVDDNAAVFVQLSKLEETWGGENGKHARSGSTVMAGSRAQAVRSTLVLAYHFLIDLQAEEGKKTNSTVTGRRGWSGSESGGSSRESVPSTTSSLLMATAGPLSVRLLESSQPSAQLLGAITLFHLLQKAPAGLLVSVEGWVAPIVLSTWDATPDFSTIEQENGNGTNLRHGKDGEGRWLGGGGGGGGGHSSASMQRQDLMTAYLASLVMHRILHLLIAAGATTLACTPTSSTRSTFGDGANPRKDGTAPLGPVRLHHTYLQALTRKVRLYASRVQSVWCLLSQSHSYVRYGWIYRLCQTYMGAFQRELVEEALEEVESAVTAVLKANKSNSSSATSTTDIATGILLANCGQLTHSMLDTMHACYHVAVHFHCLQWLSLLCATVATTAQEVNVSGESRVFPRQVAERQLHALLAPSILRLLVFYYSGGIDLSLSTPDDLRRQRVVQTCVWLLRWLVVRCYHDNVDEQKVGRGAEWLRVLAQGVVLTSTSGLESSLLALLPVSLWSKPKATKCDKCNEFS